MRRGIVAALCLALAGAVHAATATDCASVAALVDQLGPDSSVFAEIVNSVAPEDAPSPAPAGRRLLEESQRSFRACPRILSPVCSTDGRQFANDCLARNYGAEVACRGPCPCGVAAAAGQVGPVDPVQGPCPKIYSPVCGRDGRTYGNRCMAGGADKLACEGPCPCQRGAATRELLQTAEAANAGDSSDVFCPTIYMPVCGDDGKTYGNDCQAGGVGAKVACQGPCPCVTSSSGPSGPCPANYDPVCGADNSTYSNECAAGLTPIACKGECPCGGSVDGSGDGSGILCIDVVQPVCGTNNKTYTNLCTAQVDGETPACNGRCPCPDLLQALEQGGGLLLVPSDGTLLLELDVLSNVTDAAGAPLNETDALKLVLARHIILADNNKDLKPSTEGTPALTEAGERVFLVAGANGTLASVRAGPSGNDPSPVLASAASCNVTAYLLRAPLQGPLPPGSI